MFPFYYRQFKDSINIRRTESIDYRKGLFIYLIPMGISIKDFAEKILGLEHEDLKKREIFIKFIIAAGKVVFDPQLFVNFEKTYGEGSLYHKDIADANMIEKGQVYGGAYAAVSWDRVRITGKSMDFGGIEGYEEVVRSYFENYFENSVTL